jgi:starvation-inducible outer membrane lipoprotein
MTKIAPPKLGEVFRVPVRVSHSRCFATLIMALAALLLASCSTIEKVRSKDGASNDAEAVKVKPEDPLSRPIQVAWTSARAKYCGFLFDPVRLRANFLASAGASNSPEQMQKLQHAYDYTFDSVLAGIGDDPSYCSKARTDAIRADLNRYLAGDFAPTARAAR